MTPASSLQGGVAGFLRLALPMIASRAGVATMGIADAVMVSRHDPHALAALSLADGTLGRLLDVFVAFLVGGMVLVPRLLGGGDPMGAWKVWRRAIWVSVLLGVSGIAASMGCLTLWTLLGQAPELQVEAAPLARILALGFPAALVAVTTAVYLEGTGRAGFVAIAMVVANAANILLNWLLIPGHGAAGCAVATTLVRYGLAAAFVVCILRAAPAGPVPRIPEDAITARTQWRLGLGASVTIATLVTMGASLTVYAGWLGPLSLAAYAATMSLCAVLALVALGMGDATGVGVAGAAGLAGDAAAAGPAWLGLRVTVCAVAVLAATILVLAEPLARFYSARPEMQSVMVAVIPLAALSLLIDANSFVAAAALRALRDTVWPAVIQVGAMAVVVAMGWLLAIRLDLGVPGLFLAILCSSAMRSAGLGARLVRRLRGASSLRLAAMGGR